MSDFDALTSLGPQWYVAHTYNGYEKKVKTNLSNIIENRHLEDRFFEIIIPVETITEKKVLVKSKSKNSKAKPKKVAREDFDFANADPEDYEEIEEKVESKLFPSYVLIKMIMSDETWHVVRNITGVTGFVGPGSRPVPLSEEEVAALIHTEPVAAESFKVGDMVDIIGGMFAPFKYKGTLTEISENGVDVTVLVPTPGRDMPVKAKISDIRKSGEK